MKTKAFLTAMKVERNAFGLPAWIWLVFPKCFLIYNTPYPDKNNQNSWCDHVTYFHRCTYSTAVDNMKIKPEMVLFFTSFKMADQNSDFVMKESCKSFSVFYKFQMDNKWAEYRVLMRKFRKSFFLIELNSSHPAIEFLYCFDHPWYFLVITDDRTTANMDPCIVTYKLIVKKI